MDEVAYERQGKIATIMLQAVERGNAFTPSLRRQVAVALQRYRDDDDAWVGLICAKGVDFCTGSADGTPVSRSASVERSRWWAGGYIETWKPLIAAVQGRCFGEGLALALSCDLRVAQADATFAAGFSEAEPDVVAAWLIHLAGLGKALELVWLGLELDAQEAQRCGLVNRLVLEGTPAVREDSAGRLPMQPMAASLHVPGGDAYAGGLMMAEELLQYAPVTRTFQKEMALRSIGVPFAYAQTLELGPNPYGSEDRVEGTRAFVENRRPVWRNR